VQYWPHHSACFPSEFATLSGRYSSFGAVVAESDQQPHDPNERRLFPEDQAKVDAFLKRGVNSVERKPFRPVFLVILLIVVVTGFSLLSQAISRWAGVY
jgi:hypothetical protein